MSTTDISAAPAFIWLGFRRRPEAGLLNGFEPGNCEFPIHLLSEKTDVVAGFDLVEPLGLLDAKNHGHAWHVQVFQRAMPYGQFALGLVHFLHGAFRERSCAVCHS